MAADFMVAMAADSTVAVVADSTVAAEEDSTVVAAMAAVTGEHQVSGGRVLTLVAC
jgi:hypothetical protein